MGSPQEISLNNTMEHDTNEQESKTIVELFVRFTNTPPPLIELLSVMQLKNTQLLIFIFPLCDEVEVDRYIPPPPADASFELQF